MKLLIVKALLECEDEEVLEISKLSGFFRHVSDPEEARDKLYRYALMTCVSADDCRGLESLVVLQDAMVNLGILVRD